MPTGPLPKAAGRRARRNPTVAMKQLPADGRGARRAPNWPLPVDSRAKSLLPLWRERVDAMEGEYVAEDDGRRRRSLRKQIDDLQKMIADVDVEVKQLAKLEREIWTQLWRTPMAVEWEKQRWNREIAQYARHKARAELTGDLKESKAALAFADRLGLTPWSLQRLRWEVKATTVEGAPTGPGLATVTKFPGTASDAEADFA